VRRIQESFERSPRKSTRRESRELGIPQPTVWRVLRRRLLFNLVNFSNHLYYDARPCERQTRHVVFKRRVVGERDSVPEASL